MLMLAVNDTKYFLIYQITNNLIQSITPSDTKSAPDIFYNKIFASYSFLSSIFKQAFFTIVTKREEQKTHHLVKLDEIWSKIA